MQVSSGEGDERRGADETAEKGTEGKGNTEAKEDSEAGAVEDERQHEADERVALDMGAGGSHQQATSDPGEKEAEKKETRGLRWADCNDEEEEENQGEQETEGDKGERKR